MTVPLMFYDSMWPLLKRDGLAIPYIAMTLLWNRLIGYNPFSLKRNTRARYASFVSILFLNLIRKLSPSYYQAICSACLTLHLIELLIPPPQRLPDIYPVLNVLVSTPVFAFTWLWSVKRGVEVSWGLGGIGSSSSKSVVSDNDTKTPIDPPVPSSSASALGLQNVDRPGSVRSRGSQGKRSSLRVSESITDESLRRVFE